MAPKNFSLSSLIPEPMTFTDGNEVFDVKTMRMLGAGDFARINRLQRDLPAALEVLTSADDSTPETEIAAAENVERHLNSFIKLLVPDLSPERITKITFGDKAAFLNWWQTSQNEDQENIASGAVGGSQAEGQTQEQPSAA